MTAHCRTPSPPEAPSLGRLQLRLRLAGMAVLAPLTLAGTPAALASTELVQLMEQRRCPNCELAGADLVHAQLADVDLRGARLQRANLSQARLDGARLSGADLSFTSLLG
ncbi:MAG: pentapeptide repeat-containing protein, partial [Cyanobium sp.]